MFLSFLIQNRTKPDEAFYTQSFHKMRVAAMKIQS
jgi:hypothetical protein